MNASTDPKEVAYQRVAASLARQGMMQHLAVRLLRTEPGLVELALPYGDKVTQQQDGFHGGAMGALADIAGGYAGLTVAPEGMEVVTVEYKINFLSSYQGAKFAPQAAWSRRATHHRHHGRRSPTAHREAETAKAHRG